MDHLFVFLLTLFIFSHPALAVPIPRDPLVHSPVEIRVRLAEAVPSVTLHGFDLKMSESGRQAATSDRESDWDFHCQGGRVRGRSLNQSIDVKDPAVVDTPTHYIRFRERPYRGKFLIYSMGSLCEVVNELDIEKYLDGLVNAEFSSKWNPESIAAQVIAARTYAYFQIKKMRLLEPSAHFDVDSNEKDQVYDGSIKEDFRGNQTVQKTRGWVLTTGPASRPSPIKAFYHSTCGGKTVLPEKVWGEPIVGFVHTVSCPFCVSSPRYRWDLRMNLFELSEAIQRGARLDGAPAEWSAERVRQIQRSQLLALEPSDRDSDQRILNLRSVWRSNAGIFTLRIPATRLRQWIGSSKLRSTWFEISHTGSSIYFSGRGNGHGVGMCQWGAKVMGERGYTALAILKHYYPDASLRKLW